MNGFTYDEFISMMKNGAFITFPRFEDDVWRSYDGCEVLVHGRGKTLPSCIGIQELYYFYRTQPHVFKYACLSKRYA